MPFTFPDPTAVHPLPEHPRVVLLKPLLHHFLRLMLKV